ncbi:hypothetical protein AQUCO_02600136v1 [Aquilegia coerulea]|uniref:FBD domain-containing protein n=1 Tax=Aquilegia coerulea TaxID=218851 RepID=A0A2G5D7J1_AQUCA|nr:hypothetical protein AQUCO_02600136v1 [Aquilegia coerulea]
MPNLLNLSCLTTLILTNCEVLRPFLQTGPFTIVGPNLQSLSINQSSTWGCLLELNLKTPLLRILDLSCCVNQRYNFPEPLKCLYEVTVTLRLTRFKEDDSVCFFTKPLPNRDLSLFQLLQGISNVTLLTIATSGLKICPKLLEMTKGITFHKLTELDVEAGKGNPDEMLFIENLVRSASNIKKVSVTVTDYSDEVKCLGYKIRKIAPKPVELSVSTKIPPKRINFF